VQKADDGKKKALIANRSDCEKDLKFAGFIAFNCLNRTDSSLVLGELMNSGHHVIMITGDAILTGAFIVFFFGGGGANQGLVHFFVSDASVKAKDQGCRRFMSKTRPPLDSRRLCNGLTCIYMDAAAHVGTTTNILPAAKDKVLILARDEATHAWEWVRYDNDAIVAPFRAQGVTLEPSVLLVAYQHNQSPMQSG
jgi:hypothetical protein